MRHFVLFEVMVLKSVDIQWNIELKEPFKKKSQAVVWNFRLCSGTITFALYNGCRLLVIWYESEFNTEYFEGFDNVYSAIIVICIAKLGSVHIFP